MWHRTHWIVLVTLQTVLISQVQGQTYPEPNAANAGDNVTFKCRPPPASDFVYVSWVELITDPDNAHTIWLTGGKVSNPSKYSVDTGANKYDLTVKDVQIKNAGEYQCRPITGGGPQGDKKAQLTVVGNPICPNSNGQLSADVETPTISDTAKLECRINFRGNNPVQLAWYRHDGRLMDSTSTTGPEYRMQKTSFPVTNSDDKTQYECRVTVQNVDNYDATCITQPLLNVRYLVLSTVTFRPDLDEYEVGEHINCTGQGNPEPNYYWMKIAGPCTNNHSCSYVNGAILTITTDMIGQNVYRCYATNIVKGQQKTVLGEKNFKVRGQVAPPTSGTNAGAIIGGVIGAVIGACLIALLVICVIRHQSNRPTTKSTAAVAHVKETTDARVVHEQKVPDDNDYELVDEQYMTLNKSGDDSGATYKYFPLPSIEILAKLGHGKFGQVEKVSINTGTTHIIAAAKLTKYVQNENKDKLRADVEHELELMKLLPRHDNIVRLLGHSTTTDEMPIIIVEYMPLGNLQNYLRDNKATFLNYTDINDKAPKELTLFGWQVARGMDHMASHKFLHRDLAARNVLLDGNKVCKVSDFGLSREMGDAGVYSSKTSGPLPLRWMSPEALFHNIYTSNNDVWAFGVLLWEIVTLGSSPYPRMKSPEVMTYVQNRGIMAQPQHCKQEMYDIMKQCWEMNVAKRPTFTELTAMLDSLLSRQAGYLDMMDYNNSFYENIPPNNAEKV